MMGSVLSLLDPTEPIAALTGDRRLQASTLFGASIKHQHHRHNHLQPAALKASWAPARAGGQRNLKNGVPPSASASVSADRQLSGESRQVRAAGLMGLGKEQQQQQQQAGDLGQPEAAGSAKSGSRRAAAAAAEASAAAAAAVAHERHTSESAAGLQQQQGGRSQCKQAQQQQQQTDTRRRQHSQAGQVRAQRILGLGVVDGGAGCSSSTSTSGANKLAQHHEQQVAKLPSQALAAQREQRTQKSNNHQHHNSAGQDQPNATGGEQTTAMSSSSNITLTKAIASKAACSSPPPPPLNMITSTNNQLIMVTTPSQQQHRSQLSNTCRPNLANTTTTTTSQPQNKFNSPPEPQQTISPQQQQQQQQAKLMGHQQHQNNNNNSLSPGKLVMMGLSATNYQHQAPLLKGYSKRQRQQANNKMNQDHQNLNQNLRNQNPPCPNQDQANGKLQQAAGKGRNKRGSQQVRKLAVAAPLPHKAPIASGYEAPPRPEISLQGCKSLQAAEQNHQRQRDHRSLSTSSSLASSGSSSPSSSMLHIFSHRQLQRQRQRRIQLQHQQQKNNHQTNHDDNNHHQQTLNNSSRPPSSSSSSSSSSASSTISSLSSSEPPIHLLRATVPRQQQQQQQQHHQLEPAGQPMVLARAVDDVIQQPLGMNAALWALAGQQPHLVHTLGQLHPTLAAPPPPPLAPMCFFPAPPPPRPWLMKHQKAKMRSKPSMIMMNSSNRQEATPEQVLSGPEFTVISYNVLCDRLVSNKMFPSSPDIALDWQYRRELILRQLLEFDADIIALQELEVRQFEEYFGPELNQLGNYESIFEPKSRARYMDNDRRQRVDGCAIFFKRHKFRLLQSHLLEFNQIAMANAQGSEAMLNRVMTKDNIGLAAVLEFINPAGAGDDSDGQSCFKDTRLDLNSNGGRHHEAPSTRLPAGKLNPPSSSSRANSSISGGRRRHNQHLPIDNHDHVKQHPARILVCNTHIHWDPECCDVKLVQTIMLMNELECLARHYATNATTCDGSPSLLPSNASQIINHLHLEPGLKIQQQQQQTKLVHTDPTMMTSSPPEAPLLPLVLVGDFNSMPNSGVATYLAGGKINSLHDDFKSFKYTSCSNALVLHQKFHQHHWSQPSGDINNDNNNNNTTTTATATTNNHSLLTGNAAFRRQSSPAWCFYPSPNSTSNSNNSSASSSYSTSPPVSYSSTSPLSSPGSPLNQNHKSPANATKETEQQQTKRQILNYSHPFKLVSAYDKDTMPYTNYTTNFKAIIDYIFYSHDSIQLMGLLGPLDKNWLKGNRIKGLPQPHLPSDHLPLLVKLKLTTASSSRQTVSPKPPAAIPTPLSPPLPEVAIAAAAKLTPKSSHFYYSHSCINQQQTIENDCPLQRVGGGGGGGGGGKRQQLCKSQSVRLNSRNRIKYEQIRS